MLCGVRLQWQHAGAVLLARSAPEGRCGMLSADSDKLNVTIILTKAIKQFAAEESQRLGLNLSVYIRMLIVYREAETRKRLKNIEKRGLCTAPFFFLPSQHKIHLFVLICII